MAQGTYFSPYKNYLLLGMFFLIMVIVLFYFLIALGVKKGVNKRKQRKIGL
jgi:hypothetical protein